MHLEPYTEINWAYQLHYYLCFQTHRRHRVFSEDERTSFIHELLTEVCGQQGYHLLKSKIYDDHIRCLVSLRPKHVIAAVIQKLKTNLSREHGIRFRASPPLWARGYLARSVGQVRIANVRRYLEGQTRHHGYDKRPRPPVFRYRSNMLPELKAAHSVFHLAHHVVLETPYRKSVFDSASGKGLTNYWLKVAAKRGFAIEQLTILPDHVHIIVWLVPRLSIERCVLSLMNNGQHFIGKEFPRSLVEAGVERLWEPSAYAGTCGQMTTALVKSFLSRSEVRT